MKNVHGHRPAIPIDHTRPLGADTATINGRPATPTEQTVLARARAQRLAAETAALFSGIGAQR